MSSLLETAIVAARLAGRQAMQEMSSVKASVKNASELVTQADSHCQKIIIDRIRESYPDHGFVAEEGDGGRLFKQSPRADTRLWWAIDPIDGTNNFAHGMPLFAVSIAAMQAGRPIVGVIFEPATDSMFTAVTGRQAQLNGRRIEAGEEDLDKFSSVGIDSHFDCSAGIPSWACEIIKQTRFRNLGTTALQMAYVANGGLAATVVNTPKLWDIAAGTVIVEAAGAIVSDWQGGKVFPVDPATYQGGEFQVIAANPKAHTRIVELMKS